MCTFNTTKYELKVKIQAEIPIPEHLKQIRILFRCKILNGP